MLHELKLTDELTRENLFTALHWAVEFIDSYQMEIANAQSDGMTLAERGFCQGSIFANAVPQVFRIARGEWSPYADGYVPSRILVPDRFNRGGEEAG